jgi:hypothetical protein
MDTNDKAAVKGLTEMQDRMIQVEGDNQEVKKPNPEVKKGGSVLGLVFAFLNIMTAAMSLVSAKFVFKNNPFITPFEVFVVRSVVQMIFNEAYFRL